MWCFHIALPACSGGRKSSRLPSRTRTVLEYDPLQDPNLQTHFSNPIVRRQLQTVGLVRTRARALGISASGRSSHALTRGSLVVQFPPLRPCVLCAD